MINIEQLIEQSEKELMAGEFVSVRLTGVMDGELTGEAV